MTNILAALKVTETIEEQTDSLGGVSVLDSNVYPVSIQAMFVGHSASKAMSVTIHAKTKDGTDFRTTQYVTSGEAKGGKPYYERNGKKHFLPGYNIINAVCMLTCNKAIADMVIEDKVINLYDYDLKKEVPTAVPMFVDALGSMVALAVQKQVVDKNKKNDATGEYEATGETREQNEVDAVFCVETGRTLLEVKSGAEEAVFLGKWKEKWVGQVAQKAKGLEGSTGAIAKGPAAKPSKSLFA